MSDTSKEYFYHERYHDPLIGKEVGSLGAMCYILDLNGVPVTQGYHLFWMHEGALMGSVGSMKSIVVYDETEKDDERWK